MVVVSVPYCGSMTIMAERSFVLLLSASSRPSAIVRLVVAVVVDAINRVVLRCAAHVMQEGIETSHPLFAHLDTPASVVTEDRQIWVSASRAHLNPRSILAALRLSVRRRTFDGSLDRQAATTANVLKAKISGGCHRFASAVASTLPTRRGCFTRLRDALKNNKATEVLADEINAALSHFSNYTPETIKLHLKIGQ